MSSRGTANGVCQRCSMRRIDYSTSASQRPSKAAKLTNRRLISVQGQDATQFLQGLTTNKIQPERTTGVYSAFLTAQVTFIIRRHSYSHIICICIYIYIYVCVCVCVCVYVLYQYSNGYGVGPGIERCVHLSHRPLAYIRGYVPHQRITNGARLLDRGRRVRRVEIIHAPQAT